MDNPANDKPVSLWLYWIDQSESNAGQLVGEVTPTQLEQLKQTIACFNLANQAGVLTLDEFIALAGDDANQPNVVSTYNLLVRKSGQPGEVEAFCPQCDKPAQSACRHVSLESSHRGLHPVITRSSLVNLLTGVPLTHRRGFGELRSQILQTVIRRLMEGE